MATQMPVMIWEMKIKRSPEPNTYASRAPPGIGSSSDSFINLSTPARLSSQWNMRFGRVVLPEAPAAIFFSSSTASPSSRLADFFLVRHIGPEILKVDLKFSVFELGGQLIHGTWGRPEDMFPVGLEFTAMAWAD